MDVKFNNIVDLYNFSGAFRFELSVLFDCELDTDFYIQRDKLLEILYVYYYDFDSFDFDTYNHLCNVIRRFNWRS